MKIYLESENNYPEESYPFTELQNFIKEHQDLQQFPMAVVYKNYSCKIFNSLDEFLEHFKKCKIMIIEDRCWNGYPIKIVSYYSGTNQVKKQEDVKIISYSKELVEYGEDYKRILDSLGIDDYKIRTDKIQGYPICFSGPGIKYVEENYKRFKKFLDDKDFQNLNTYGIYFSAPFANSYNWQDSFVFDRRPVI